MISENYEQFKSVIETFGLSTKERYLDRDVLEVIVMSKRDNRRIREPVYFNKHSLERLWDYDRYNEIN